MNIKLNVNSSKYAITSDRYNIILNKISVVKEGKNKGNDKLYIVGYYKDVVSAVTSLYDYELIHNECETLDEFKLFCTDTRRQLVAEVSKMIKLIKRVG